MMVEVAVKVPADQVEEFYSMFGLWLQRAQPGSTETGTDPREAWSTEDGELAAQVWPDLPANSIKMLEFIIRAGNTDSMLVVEALGLKDPTQIVGVHGWIGRICSQFNRKSPIKARPSENGTVWSIDPEIAAMFTEAKGA